MKVSIYKEMEFEDLPLPCYATSGSAGADLYAAINEPIVLSPGQRARISTGIRIALPQGYEAQIRPRSGLADRYGITLLNAPGTIDSDYRGVIQVIVINHGTDDFTISRADRVAQLILAPVLQVEWEQTTDLLNKTGRQDGGFGHTGIAGT